FAENGPGGTFVVAGRTDGTNRRFRQLKFRVMGVGQIAIEHPSASQWACIPEPSRLGVGAEEEARSCRSKFFVAGNQRRMAQLVAQLNPGAHGPMRVVATYFQVGVLRTGSGNEAHLPADG